MVNNYIRVAGISIHALVKRATTFSGKVGIARFISIHALVKRATSQNTTTAQGQEISIHALVKRATLLLYGKPSTTIDFNPRPREEGDLALRGVEGGVRNISIHALVKRATQGAVIATRNSPISIHALVKRATGAV